MSWKTPPGKNEADLLKFLDALDGEASAARSKVAGDEKWKGYLDLVRGKGNTRNRLFSANFIGNAVERKAAILTETKPEIYVAPRRNGLKATADELQKTIEAGWDVYNMALAMDTLAQMMETFGGGGFYIGYDPAACNGLGDLVLNSVDPRTMGFDPAVTYSYDLDGGQYVWGERIASLWDLQLKFPGRGALVEPDRRVSAFDKDDASGSTVSSAIKRARGIFKTSSIGDGAIPRAFVRDYYFRDPLQDASGVLKYPFGRHVVRGGSNVVLLDEPNPFFDGGWPYLYIDGSMDLDHPWGRSGVAGLERIQKASDRIGHMFVENAILTGNSWIIGDADALPPEMTKKLSNLGAVYLEKKLGRDVQRQPPPQMPPHMMGFIEMAMRLVDFLTGLGEGGAGRRTEVRSGAQIEGLQNAAQTLIRAQARRLESFLERLGTKWISRIFQFYTDDRLMLVLGGDNTFQQFVFEREALMQQLAKAATSEAVNAAQADKREATMDEIQAKISEAMRSAWREFTFKIKPGSSLAMTKQQRALMYADLAKNGLASRKRVLQELGIENADEEIAQALREIQQFGPPQQGTPTKGRPKAA